jgi:YbbR domain-containing protein
MNRSLHTLHDLFIKNLNLKLFALVIALLLWIAINRQPNEPNDTRWLKVPLVVRNLPEPRYEQVGEPVYGIDVQLTGPSSVVRRLSSDEASAILDLKNFQPRVKTYLIAPADIHFPSFASGKVIVQEIIPSQIRMEFDETISRQVEVQPRILGKGEVAPGFQISRISCQPETVLIQGPLRYASQAAALPTEPIDVKGEKSTIHRRVRILSDSHQIRLPQSTEIDVTIEIIPTEKHKGK